MTHDEARAVLGIGATADAGVVRDAFLQRVRENHPDVTARPEGAAERTATIITAYRLLRDVPPPPAAPPSVETFDPTTFIEVITAEAIWVGAGIVEVGQALLLVADDLGEVSYVDRSGGLVQVTVRPPDGPTCWFTISAHARPGGTVLVATLESIESQPTPPAGALVAELAEALAGAFGASRKIPRST